MLPCAGLLKIIPLLLLCFLLIEFPALCRASQAEDEVAKIQRAYETIKDVSGTFVQKSFIKDLKRTETYRGQFSIKASKMKWEYKGDKPQVVYINGDDIIIYQKKENQVFKAKFDKSTYGQAPIALLGGLGDITKEFDVSMRNGKLLLKPKNPMGNVASVELTLSGEEFPIASLTVIDTLSNTIDIRLKDVRVNTGLKNSVFEFTPPKGVTTIQH